MKVLVVYDSCFGATKGIAERIAGVLRRRGLDVDLEAADEASEVVGSSYDAYVVGSAIHGRRWLPGAVAYVERNSRVLASRPVWLFSSGPVGERYVHLAQPEPREIPQIRRSIEPRDHVIFAGAYDRAAADFSGLGWMERNVAARLLPQGDFRDWAVIEAWADAIAGEVTPIAVASASNR